jgi:hypothetical protein
MASTLTIPLTVTNDSITGFNGLTANQFITDSFLAIQALTGSSVSPLTAFITGFAINEIDNGAPSFVFGTSDIFSYTILTSAFPVTFGIYPNGSPFGSVSLSLSGLGNPCASGLITLNYVVSLSSGALSGNNLGATTFVNILNTTDSTQSTIITAVNTPYNNRTCLQEFERLRYLGYF